MTRALFHLLLLNFKGRIRRSLRLARRPKYLFGLVVGALYLGGVVLRPILASEAPGEAFTTMPPELFQALHVVIAMGIAFYLSFSWVVMPVQTAVNLRTAELHLLLSAPLSRRQVIQYSVLKNLPGMVLGTLVISLFMTGGSVFARGIQALNIFTLLFLWDLHGKGRSFWKARLGELPPRQAVPRRIGMILVVSIFWAVAVVCLVGLSKSFFAAVNAQGGMSQEAFRAAAAEVGRSGESGLLRVLLTPLLWITAPYFARLTGTPWYSLVFLFGLTAAHYLWVVASQTRFEEATLERERRNSMAGTRRGGLRRYRQGDRHRRAHPFPLRPSGSPEIAMLWKDMVLITRRRLSRVAGLALVLLAALALALTLAGAPERAVYTMGVVALAAMGTFAMFSGIFWSNGFRRDLRYFDSIRTWPVAPHRLVRGEILAPLAQTGSILLTALGLLLAGEVSLRLAGMMRGAGLGQGYLPETWAVTLGVPDLVLPLLLIGAFLPVLGAAAFMSSALECVAALAFPGWILVLDQHRGDPSAMGQRILVSVVFFVAVFIGAIPGAVLLALMWAGHRALDVPLSGWELPILGLLAALPLALEGVGLLRLGGRLWNKIDLSQEILEGH